MKVEYWIEHEFGKLYKVKYDNGNYSVEVYSGTEEECEQWIKNNS